MILCEFRLRTLTFKVFHKFSIGFQSGDWLGQLRVLIPLFSNHPFVSFAVCLGSLSCWRNYARKNGEKQRWIRVDYLWPTIESDWKQWNKTEATQQNIELMYPILLQRVILNFDKKKKKGFNHEFLIFPPNTTKTTLRDITYQISSKMANINSSYNRK